jgi:hypothetical protein
LIGICSIRLDGNRFSRRGRTSAPEHGDFGDECKDAQEGGDTKEDDKCSCHTVVYDEFGNVMVLVPK